MIELIVGLQIVWILIFLSISVSLYFLLPKLIKTITNTKDEESEDENANYFGSD